MQHNKYASVTCSFEYAAQHADCVGLGLTDAQTHPLEAEVATI